ncbi:unnamed protein product [Aureobasidium pullulans]|nr:unnamed protein product [Aureobasidium pullulans]
MNRNTISRIEAEDDEDDSDTRSADDSDSDDGSDGNNSIDTDTRNEQEQRDRIVVDYMADACRLFPWTDEQRTLAKELWDSIEMPYIDDDAENILWSKVMWSNNDADRFSMPLNDLEDDPTWTKRGVSFLNNSKNGLEDKREVMLGRAENHKTDENYAVEQETSSFDTYDDGFAVDEFGSYCYYACTSLQVNRHEEPK